MISVPAYDRYLPLVPCPWRHDLGLKPPSQPEGEAIDIASELRWMHEKWRVNFGQVTRHILYDLDSWYLQGIGTCTFDLPKIRAATESAVQKLLKNGSASITPKETDIILEEYALPNSGHLSLEQLVAQVEDLKCKATGPTFFEALRADPFHSRHLGRFPTGSVNRVVVSMPVSNTQLPNAYAELYADQRDYTELEQHLLDVYYEFGRTSLLMAPQPATNLRPTGSQLLTHRA